jgi:sulfonate transport system permease protein
MTASAAPFGETRAPLARANRASLRRRARSARVALPARLAVSAVSLLVPLVLLALWQAVTALNWLSPLVLPSPASVFAALQDMVLSGDLAANLGISLERVVLGFAAGAASGLVVGGLIGLSRIMDALLRPTLTGFVQVPVLAWIPLLMIPFGIGETLKLVAIGMAAFTPVAMNTAKGFRQVPQSLVEIGTVYRLTWLQRTVHILLPGAFPAVFTGLRLGLTSAWHSLVVVELVASTEGIGYMAVMARQMFQLDVMLATMAVIGVVGFTLDRSLRGAEDALGRRYGAAAA